MHLSYGQCERVNKISTGNFYIHACHAAMTWAKKKRFLMLSCYSYRENHNFDESNVNTWWPITTTNYNCSWFKWMWFYYLMELNMFQFEMNVCSTAYLILVTEYRMIQHFHHIRWKRECHVSLEIWKKTSIFSMGFACKINRIRNAWPL